MTDSPVRSVAPAPTKFARSLEVAATEEHRALSSEIGRVPGDWVREIPNGGFCATAPILGYFDLNTMVTCKRCLT